MKFRDFYLSPEKKAPTLLISATRARYTDRYNALKKIKKEIYVKIYIENEKSYYFHVLVPSDMREMHYDVVIHFTDSGDHMSLRDWDVKLFSNCPSFVYNYAYVYLKNNLFIPQLKDKLNNIVFETKPENTNPSKFIMYDKSIFYAIHHIFRNTRYISRYMIHRDSLNYNESELINSIRSFDDIMNEISNNKKDTGINTLKKLGERSKVTKAVKKTKERINKTVRRIAKIKPIKKK